jgi:hypothetical protein
MLAAISKPLLAGPAATRHAPRAPAGQSGTSTSSYLANKTGNAYNQAAGTAPSARYVLASSFECAVAGCSYENAVLRYNASTGAYGGLHISNISGPYGMIVHRKTGRLLIAMRDDDKVAEYDARTGVYIRDFVTPGSGGLGNPKDLLLTAQNRLLVTSTPEIGSTGVVNGILEYDGDTGAFIRVLVNGGSINPAFPEDCGDPSCIRGANNMAIGPTNGNLYVVSGLTGRVLEYNTSTGAYVGRIVSPYLIEPIGLLIRNGATRPGNLLVTTRWVDPAVQGDGEKILEFDYITRNLYPQWPVLATGLIAPGPMMFNDSGNILVTEFVGSVSTIQPDRIVLRHGIDGHHMAIFSGSNPNLHGPTGLTEIAFGLAGGDADGDMDRDLKDYASLQRCVNPFTTACRTAFDDDGNTSLAKNDIQAFISGFVGPKFTCTSGSQCNDANPCTTDTCTAGNCVHTNVSDGTSCSDSSYCDGVEVCRHGICDGVGPCVDDAHCSESLDVCLDCVANSECDDGNPCTMDLCQGDSGCAHIPQSGSCDDGNACTLNDFCSGGTCVGGSARNCNDNNICTTDSCSPATGCTYNFANFDPCDDNNICTYNDFCLSANCIGGPQIDCDDENVCTQDFCLPQYGCQNQDNSMMCDDEDPCTIDSCVPSTGCEHEEPACGPPDQCCPTDCSAGADPDC